MKPDKNDEYKLTFGDVVGVIIVAAIIFSLFMLGSCCPKVVPSTTVTVKSDTVVTYVTDTVQLPVVTDYYTFDFNAICDSLQALKQRPASVPVTFAVKSNQRPASHAMINLENSGTGTVFVNIDSLLAVIDSLTSVVEINNIIETKTDNVVYKCQSKFHNFTVIWFFITVALLTFIVLRRTKVV